MINENVSRLLTVGSHEGFTTLGPQLFPAIAALATTEEHNPPLHCRQSVLNHTAQALGWHLTDASSLPPSQLEHLYDKLGGRTRLEGLRLAVILHDIGKPLTITKNPDGTTSCPGHEEAGAKLAQELLADEHPRFSAYVVELVRRHGLLHEVMNKRDDEAGVFDQAFAQWRAANAPYERELLHLAMVDILGSHLALFDPFEFASRMCFIKLNLEALR